MEDNISGAHAVRRLARCNSQTCASALASPVGPGAGAPDAPGPMGGDGSAAAGAPSRRNCEAQGFARLRPCCRALRQLVAQCPHACTHALKLCLSVRSHSMSALQCSCMPARQCDNMHAKCHKLPACPATMCSKLKKAASCVHLLLLQPAQHQQLLGAAGLQRQEDRTPCSAWFPICSK